MPEIPKTILMAIDKQLTDDFLNNSESDLFDLIFKLFLPLERKTHYPECEKYFKALSCQRGDYMKNLLNSVEDLCKNQRSKGAQIKDSL